MNIMEDISKIRGCTEICSR